MRVEAVCSFFLSFFSATRSVVLCLVSLALARLRHSSLRACFMPAWLGLLAYLPACLLAARYSVDNARFASQWTSFVYE